MARTFSGLCGLGVLAGATMLPVTSVSSPQGKNPSQPGLDNNQRGQGSVTSGRATNPVLRLVLGEELAASRRLNHYFLFVLTDFLCFTSVYIPYTHLPNFAEVTNCLFVFEILTQTFLFQSQGVSAANAAFLISVGGICNTVGAGLRG